MKYELIKEVNPCLSAVEQVLYNRGIPQESIYKYLTLTDEVINSPTVFGEKLMLEASKLLALNLHQQNNIIGIVTDPDVDGYTSAAIIINYLYDLVGESLIPRLRFFMHENKQHGLSDVFEEIKKTQPDLLILPDSSSNDIQFLSELYKIKKIGVIILDHHLIEKESLDYWGDENIHYGDKNEILDAQFLINNQSPQYPNKALCGAAVVYQFCKYLDNKAGFNYADNYLDLVATGLIGDMVSLRSMETRRLITKGLNPANIINPFVYSMWQKNKFKLGEYPTGWGFTFYIVPLVNAITRTGTKEEKMLVFKSMLKFFAFEEIESTKRGHRVGETERLVDQAIRVCTNVKNRQTKEEQKGLEFVEKQIEEYDLLKNKVLLFLVEDDSSIRGEIRGLLANKMQAKYQRPCCVLSKVVDKETGRISYQGSARGCDKVGITDFKSICEQTNVCDYTVGHPGAFGLSITTQEDNTEGSAEIAGENLYQFIDKTNTQLKEMPSEPTYKVDYIWNSDDSDAYNKILEIGEMDNLWGKDIEVSLVAIKNIKVTKENLKMMASNTVKITLPNDVSLIQFRMPEEEYEKLYTENGYVIIDIVGECNINEWNFNKYPQIFIKDYEIIDKVENTVSNVEIKNGSYIF